MNYSSSLISQNIVFEQNNLETTHSCSNEILCARLKVRNDIVSEEVRVVVHQLPHTGVVDRNIEKVPLQDTIQLGGLGPAGLHASVT